MSQDANGFELVGPETDDNGFEVVSSNVDANGFQVVGNPVNTEELFPGFRPERIPRDGMERAGRDFFAEQAAAPEIRKLPPGGPALSEVSRTEALMNKIRSSAPVEALLGPADVSREGGVGSDIERKGLLPTVASIPARIGTTTGKLAKAGVADVAAAMTRVGSTRVGSPTANDKTEEGNFGGNVKAMAQREEKLPVERALELSKAEDQEKGVLGWQTIAADISLGLADLAPKVALMEGAPGGMLAKSGAGAAVFGFDEQNKFHPKSAAFAAAFPFVTKAAAVATDAAIAKAVERGFEWAGTPAAQRALHVAANQAAMDALMTAQSAPELLQLSKENPDEFKRELAKILGSNLAFAIPEALAKREPITRQRENTVLPESDKTPLTTGTVPESGTPAVAQEPPAVPESAKAPVTRDLVAELKAAMEQNQIAAPAGKPTAADAVREIVQDTIAKKAAQAKAASEQRQDAELLQQVEKNAAGPGSVEVRPIAKTGPTTEPVLTTAELTKFPEAAITESTAPETSTGGTAAETGVSIGTQEQTGSTAQRSAIPAEEGSGPSRSAVASRTRAKDASPGITEADGLLFDLASNWKIPAFIPDGILVAQYRRLRNKYKAGGFANMTAKERDLYRRILESFPHNYEDDFGVDGEAMRRAYDAAKKAGIAGELFERTKTAKGMRFDSVLDFVKKIKGEDFDARRLWSTIEELSNAHRARNEGTTREDRAIAAEEEQHLNFARDNNRNAKGTAIVMPDDLHEGTSYTLRGVKLRVTDIEFDEDGRLTAVTLDDGKRYGTQTVELAGEHHTAIRADTGSVTQPKNDPIMDWLNKAYEATDPNKTLEGGELHALALPVWLAREVSHAAIGVIRKAYQVGKTIKEAIDDGIAWLRSQKIEGFNEEEARAWLKQEVKNANPVIERKPMDLADQIRAEQGDTLPENERETSVSREEQAENGPEYGNEPESPPEPGERDWREVKRELGEASDALREALRKNDPKQAGGMSRADVRQAIALATARYRNRQEELLNHPEYVADLLTRNDRISDQLKADPDNRELRFEQDGIRADLDGVSAGLRNRIYNELQEKGVIAKPPPGPPVGRSLDELTEWIKQAGIDSPKRSLRERLALGQRIVDRWTWIKDASEKARLHLGMTWKAAISAYKNPPVDTGFRRVFKDWIFNDQYTGLQTRKWVQEINRQIEDPDRQAALSIWLDAKGDETLLRYQAQEIPKAYRKVWDLALKLTPKEKELGQRIKEDFEVKLHDSMAAGMVEKGRADYGVPQRWETPPTPDPAVQAAGRKGSPGNPYAKLDPRDPFFAFQRTHPTYFDGIMAGGKPISLKIGDLVADYNYAFHKALSSRAAIWGLKNEVAADGRPLVKISGRAHQADSEKGGAYFVDSKARDSSDVSADGRPYRSIDHFAMRDWKVAYKTSDGKTVLVRGDMLVHPDHFEFLNNELMGSALKEGPVRRALDPIFRSNVYMKSSKLAFAGFHLTTIGNHMVSHLINPFVNGFEIDLRKPDQALLVRNGLELGMGAQRVAFEEGLASHGGLFRQVPLLGDYSARFTDWMFKDYIPRIMMKAGLVVLDANRQRYTGKLTENQIAELTAHQMNAAGGLQNYRLLGRNKLLLDLNRMVLLAPQFLESRAKVVAQALKPHGAEQRKMLLLQAGAMYVGCRVLNMLLDDDPHWEFKAALGVVFHGRLYSIRTIVGDAWHLATDPHSFAAGRLAPLARMAYETISQRDLRTGARKEPPIQTEWAIGRIAQNLVVDAAKWLLPIGAEGLLPGAAGREQRPIDTALGAVGIGSRKYTAQTRVWDWAKTFNRDSGDIKAQKYQQGRDAEARVEGAYRKLDALIDAGELADARLEYKHLLRDGKEPEVIARRYRHNVSSPFTGTKEREHRFYSSLSARERIIYDRAVEERRKRLAGFSEMMRGSGESN